MDYDTDWTMISFEPKKPAVVKIAAGSQSERNEMAQKMHEHVRNHNILAALASAKKSCPECGRELGKGGHNHVKYCSGKARDAKR
jgi:hypothetical protein